MVIGLFATQFRFSIVGSIPTISLLDLKFQLTIERYRNLSPISSQREDAPYPLKERTPLRVGGMGIKRKRYHKLKKSLFQKLKNTKQTQREYPKGGQIFALSKPCFLKNIFFIKRRGKRVVFSKRGQESKKAGRGPRKNKKWNQHYIPYY